MKTRHTQTCSLIGINTHTMACKTLQYIHIIAEPVAKPWQIALAESKGYRKLSIGAIPKQSRDIFSPSSFFFSSFFLLPDVCRHATVNKVGTGQLRLRSIKMRVERGSTYQVTMGSLVSVCISCTPPSWDVPLIDRILKIAIFSNPNGGGEGDE